MHMNEYTNKKEHEMGKKSQLMGKGKNPTEHECIKEEMNSYVINKNCKG